MPGAEVGDLPAGYPSRWEADVVLADGATVHLRPIKPSDGPGISALHSRLTPETVYFRFFSLLPRLSPKMLDRFVNVDYVDRLALVAELGDRLIAVARYDRLDDRLVVGEGPEAEVAFVVDDAHQGRGVGTILLEHLAAAAKANGIARFVADTLPQNSRMLRMFHEAGYADERRYEEGVIRVTFPLDATAALPRHPCTTGSAGPRPDPCNACSRPAAWRSSAPAASPVASATRCCGTSSMADSRARCTPCTPPPSTWPACGPTRRSSTCPYEVDLAVIAVPAEGVAAVVDQCAAKGVGGLVILSSGFAERSADGAAAERRLVSTARLHGMRLVGPNCLGLINTDPAVSMNATFSPFAPTRGPDRVHLPVRWPRRGHPHRDGPARPRRVHLRLRRQQGRREQQRPHPVLGERPEHERRPAVPRVVREPPDVCESGPAPVAAKADRGREERPVEGGPAGRVAHRRHSPPPTLRSTPSSSKAA